jgi:hypothetical protein
LIAHFYAAALLAILLAPAAHASAFSPDRIQLSEPVLRSDSSELEPTSAGDQVGIATTLHNNDDKALSFFVIIEVRDAQGFTTQLNWVEVHLDEGEDAETGISWIPSKTGNYELRAFVLTDIANPLPLSQIAESGVDIA